MRLLSISNTNHDANISYYDGNMVHYLKLERTERNKRFARDDVWEIKYQIKKIWNISFDDVDEISFNFDIAVIKKYGLLSNENYLNLAFSNIEYFELDDNIKNIISINTKTKIYKVSHHYLHNLSACMLSNKEPTISIVIDGHGDNKVWSIYKNNKLIDYSDKVDNSIGDIFIQMGKYLHVAGHELDMAGKIMGLQSYGNIDDNYLVNLRKYNIYDIKHIIDLENWYKYKGSKLSGNLDALNWCKTVCKRIEEILIELFKKHAKKDEVIAYSGGVAHNIIWNKELKKCFPNLIIPPHCGDEGLSLGGLEWLRRKNNIPKFNIKNFPYMQNDYAPNTTPTEETIKNIAKLLSEGKIVGWYQGHGEIGPRALGNRSILMDPRIPNGKQKINSIKNREDYRPFGASVLKEHQHKYFDMEWDDEYMLFSCNVKTDILPSVTHVDGTCRVQTVGNKNPIFRKLLEEFYKISNCAVLLNTSLNMAGEPLSAYPESAIDLLLTGDIDYVVIGNETYAKY